MQGLLQLKLGIPGLSSLTKAASKSLSVRPGVMFQNKLRLPANFQVTMETLKENPYNVCLQITYFNISLTNS